ncbi:MAG: hypothetical protein WCG74_12930, partial [Sediminibacterium sp.]
MNKNIVNNLNNPAQLEKLYRDNKTSFKKEFNLIYPENKDLLVLQYWNERLNYESEKKSFGTKKELLFVLVIALLAGLVANIPNITGINEERFFSKNISFIVFPFLSFYFISSQKLALNKFLFPALAILISVFYINLLPYNIKSNSIILAQIHLPLFLWAVLGYAFLGNTFSDRQKRIDFLKFNG